MRLVGTEYPEPVVDTGSGKGRRRLWLKRDLDKVLGLAEGEPSVTPEAEF
ncbi:hypothetical protein [Mesorhizobium silamurunense]|nr:hypothetical protein [Mesorhizobium silamurunense]